MDYHQMRHIIFMQQKCVKNGVKMHKMYVKNIPSQNMYHQKLVIKMRHLLSS